MTWEWGDRTEKKTLSLKCSVKNLYDMNRSCSLSKTEINQKPMHVVPDPLLFGLSSPKTFTLRNMPYTLSFCAEPKAKLQNPSSKRSPLPSRSGGAVLDDEWGPGKNSFPHPSSSILSTLFLGRRFHLHTWGSGFCNSGQALRKEWHGTELIERKKKHFH